MPQIAISVTHRFSKTEALEKVKGLLGDLKSEFTGKFEGLDEQWDENGGNFSCRARGLSVSGRLDVEVGRVSLSANLPFAAFAVKGKIERAFRERLESRLRNVPARNPVVRQKVQVSPIKLRPEVAREERYSKLARRYYRGEAFSEPDRSWFNREHKRRLKKIGDELLLILGFVVVGVVIVAVAFCFRKQ